MPLPTLVRQAAEKKVGDYCAKKVPPHLAEKIKVYWEIRGSAVTIFESRPLFSDPSTWAKTKVAQLRYDSNANKWTLYCADRNGKWHLYMQKRGNLDISALLVEIDRDPTGIFWG